MIKYSVEPWPMIWPEVEPLLRAHHEELEKPDARRPFAPDIDTIAAFDKNAILLCVTAREDEALIGYCSFYLAPDLESKGVKRASQGPWYVLQAKREEQPQAGLRLLHFGLNALRLRGVQMVSLHHYMTPNAERLAEVFKRMGAVEVMHEFDLWIGV